LLLYNYCLDGQTSSSGNGEYNILYMITQFNEIKHILKVLLSF